MRSVKHCVAEVERPSLICLCDIWASFLIQSNNAQPGVGGPSVDQGFRRALISSASQL